MSNHNQDEKHIDMRDPHERDSEGPFGFRVSPVEQEEKKEIEDAEKNRLLSNRLALIKASKTAAHKAEEETKKRDKSREKREEDFTEENQPAYKYQTLLKNDAHLKRQALLFQYECFEEMAKKQKEAKHEPDQHVQKLYDLVASLPSDFENSAEPSRASKSDELKSLLMKALPNPAENSAGFVEACKNIADTLIKFPDYAKKEEALLCSLQQVVFQNEAQTLRTASVAATAPESAAAEASASPAAGAAQPEEKKDDDVDETTWSALHKAVQALDVSALEVLLKNEDGKLLDNPKFVNECTSLAEKLTEHSTLAQSQEKFLFCLRHVAFRHEIRLLKQENTGDNHAIELYTAVENKDLNKLSSFHGQKLTYGEQCKELAKVLMAHPNMGDKAEQSLRLLLEIAYDPKDGSHSRFNQKYTCFRELKAATSTDIYLESGVFKHGEESEGLDLMKRQRQKLSEEAKNNYPAAKKKSEELKQAKAKSWEQQKERVTNALKVLRYADHSFLALLIDKTVQESQEARPPDLNQGRENNLNYPLGEYFEKMKGVAPENNDIWRSALIHRAASVTSVTSVTKEDPKKGHFHAFSSLIKQNRMIAPTEGEKQMGSKKKEAYEKKRDERTDDLIELLFQPVQIELNALLQYQETSTDPNITEKHRHEQRARRKKYLADIKDLKASLRRLVSENIVEEAGNTENLMKVTAFIAAFRDMLTSFAGNKPEERKEM